MRSFDLNEISLLQIKIFITAATELNFTRTASICYVTQPTVSRSIESLEQLLGLQLFAGRKNAKQLTPAGKALLVSFQSALNEIVAGVTKAHEMQEGYNRWFNIAFPENVDPSIFLFPLINSYKVKDRDVRIKYSLTKNITYEIQKLFDYKTDVIFTHLHNQKLLSQYNNLQYEKVISTPLMAFMLRTNPLSSRRSVTIEDLRAQHLFLPLQHDDPAYYHMVLDLFRKSHIIPIVDGYNSSASESLMNIDQDNQIVICDNFFLSSRKKNCVSVPIESTESGFLLIMRENEPPESGVTGFYQFTENYLKEKDYSQISY